MQNNPGGATGPGGSQMMRQDPMSMNVQGPPGAAPTPPPMASMHHPMMNPSQSSAAVAMMQMHHPGASQQGQGNMNMMGMSGMGGMGSGMGSGGMNVAGNPGAIGGIPPGMGPAMMQGVPNSGPPPGNMGPGMGLPSVLRQRMIRCAEIIEQLRMEFEHAYEVAESYSGVRDDNARKIEGQVREIQAVEQALMDLERRNQQMREIYERDIMMLNQRLAQASAAASQKQPNRDKATGINTMGGKGSPAPMLNDQHSGAAQSQQQGGSAMGPGPLGSMDPAFRNGLAPQSDTMGQDRMRGDQMNLGAMRVGTPSNLGGPQGGPGGPMGAYPGNQQNMMQNPMDRLRSNAGPPGSGFDRDIYGHQGSQGGPQGGPQQPSSHMGPAGYDRQMNNPAGGASGGPGGLGSAPTGSGPIGGVGAPSALPSAQTSGSAAGGILGSNPSLANMMGPTTMPNNEGMVQVPEEAGNAGVSVVDDYVVYQGRLSTGSLMNINCRLQNTIQHEAVVCCVRYSWNGQYLATGSKYAQMFDSNTGAKIATFGNEVAAEADPDAPDSYVRAVCFSPDGKWLITGSEDHTVKIWDVRTHQVRHRLVGHGTDIYSVEASPDGKFIISGSGDKKAILWGLESGKMLTTLDGGDYGPTDGITSVAVSPSSQFVAAGSLDKIVRVWEVETGRLIRSFEGHRDSVYAVAFSPDGRMLLSGSLDKTLKLWDLSASQPSNQCRLTFTGHTDFVLSVCFSPNGRWLISGGKDRTIQFWDPRHSTMCLMLQGHRNAVISIAHSPTTKSLATGSGDHRARTWMYYSSPQGV